MLTSAFLHLTMPSNIIAVYEHSLNAYLLRPTGIFPVVMGIPLPEIAANVLRQTAPPATIKAAIISFGYETFDARRKCVEAFQKEGYTNLLSIDIRSIKLTSSILGLPLKCDVGEPVFINCTEDYVDPFVRYTMYVIQKCENGWQIINTLQMPATALSQYPSARNVVIYKNAPMAIKKEVKKLFPGLQLHFSDKLCHDIHVKYMRNLVNNGNFNGYQVLPFCNVLLTVEYSNNQARIPLTDRVPPFTIEKEIDVGDAPFVTIYGESVGLNPSSSEMKMYSFKTKAFRKVLVTVVVDKTLIPTISLKTASTYQPRDRSTPVIYVARRTLGVYILNAVFEEHVSSEGAFATAADVVTHMMKSSTVEATKTIYFVYAAENTIKQLQEFRDLSAETKGYPEVQFIYNDSLNLSFCVDRAGISVTPGQIVAMIAPQMVYVIQRDGDFLQVRDTSFPQNFNINAHNIDTVIIENMENIFTQTDLEYLRLKYYPRTVIFLPGIDNLKQPIPKYFWSRFNKADYGGNFFNDFGRFNFQIEGDGVSETVETLFKAIPYTKTTTVTVGSAKTLTVNILRTDGDTTTISEFLKKFDVPQNANALRFTICVKSACDVTVTMDADDKLKASKKQNAIENHEHRGMKFNVPTVDLHVQFGINNKMVFLNDRAIPFNTEVDVGDASDVVVRVGPHGVEPTTFKTLKFKNLAFRKISIMVDVDEHFNTQLTLRTASTYKPTSNSNSLDAALPLLKFNSTTPMTVLTFTSDNRVLIQPGKTFTGDKEILAYVWLQCGKVPLIGKYAFDALKTHSDSVFYGITRLLATDFDPDLTDPAWRFKTTRDVDGKLLVHGGDDIVTLPIVLFGLVIKSTFLYIKEHQKSEITELGIRLPAGCVVSDAELNDISPLIGVELKLL